MYNSKLKTPRRGSKLKNLKFLQPLDRIALGLMLVLSFLILLLIIGGDHTVPLVRNFSWENKHISGQDTSFILNFSRPMDRTSVEAGLQIQPLLPGKVSWAGRKMAYTLLNPAPYGTEYRLQLEGAREGLPGKTANENGRLVEPFLADFRTRDRAFAYVGVEGQEQGRLILYNLTKQQKTVLTPANLVVKEFKPYHQADRILFLAAERSRNNKGLPEQQLYVVTTGLNYQSPGEPETPSTQPGKIDLILDSKQYQNLKFDLSINGEVIVVQRLNKRKPSDFGLWVLRSNSPAEPLQNEEVAGDFVIAPDSNSLAVAQGQGVAILPLKTAEKPLDFLPKFGMVLSFDRKGTAATMVKFNTDYTQSLFLVTTQGVSKELLRTTGSIINAQFDPTGSILYCLLTELKEEKSEEYSEQPYLAAIDLKTLQITPLLQLPQQRDIQMSLSPDGLALLFDQTVPEATPKPDSLTDNEGQAIASGRLWLLPLMSSTPESTAQIQPEELPLPGFRPRWLP